MRLPILTTWTLPNLRDVTSCRIGNLPRLQLYSASVLVAMLNVHPLFPLARINSPAATPPQGFSVGPAVPSLLIPKMSDQQTPEHAHICQQRSLAHKHEGSKSTGHVQTLTRAPKPQTTKAQQWWFQAGFAQFHASRAGQQIYNISTSHLPLKMCRANSCDMPAGIGNRIMCSPLQHPAPTPSPMHPLHRSLPLMVLAERPGCTASGLECRAAGKLSA